MPSKTKQVHLMENLKIGGSLFVDGAKPTVPAALTNQALSPVIQQLEIPLSSFSVTVTDTGGANGGYGTQELLTFPSKHVLLLGCMMDLAVVAAAGIAADATLAFAIGTAAEATDDTLDSTQADRIASTACALTASAGSCDNSGPAAPAVVDATAGTSKLHLDVGCPDADITASSSVALTGSIHIFYIDLSQGEA